MQYDNASISDVTDNSSFWQKKNHHNTSAHHRSYDRYAHLIEYYQQKISELQWQIIQKKQINAAKQFHKHAKAMRLTQPVETTINTLKEKAESFDPLMQQIDHLLQSRLIPAIHQAQSYRHAGNQPQYQRLITQLRTLILAHATQNSTMPRWQKMLDHLTHVNFKNMAAQTPAFLDFLRQHQVTAQIATRECQRDTRRLIAQTHAFITLITQLETLNKRSAFKALPAASLSVHLTSTATTASAVQLATPMGDTHETPHAPTQSL